MLTEAVYYITREFTTGMANVKVIPLTGIPMVPGWECYRTEAGGVNCYSSKDLLNWKYEGLVLQPEMSDTQSDLHPSKVLERPKVIYNE